MRFCTLKNTLATASLTVVTVLFLSCQLFLSISAAGTFEVACEKGVTSDNKTLDTCDSAKFLTCREGRCLCEDPTNQIWGSRRNSDSNSNSNSDSPPSLISLLLSRTKRAKGGFRRPSKPKLPSRPKGSSGSSNIGGIAAGAGVGAGAGYLAGSLLNRGSAPTTSRPSVSSSGEGSRRKVYGCYGRVGAQCVLDSPDTAQSQSTSTTPSTTTTTTTTTTEKTTVDSNSTTTPIPTMSSTETSASTQASTLKSDAVSMETSTTTTTPTDATTLPSSSSSTTSTTPEPSSSTTTTTAAPSVDISKIPKCIENAECKVPEIKIVDGKVVSGGEVDPKFGVCTCSTGYRKNSQDICVKV